MATPGLEEGSHWSRLPELRRRFAPFAWGLAFGSVLAASLLAVRRFPDSSASE